MPLDKLPIKISAGLGLSMIDRAVKEMHASRCKKAELEEVRRYFQKNGELRCIYCGATGPTRWDHLHPVSRGGDTVPGNLVPACGRCDDSKQDREVEEWARSTSSLRPQQNELPRIRREVKKYQKKFNYIPRKFESKLSDEQMSIYQSFQRELQKLRTHLQSMNLLK